MPFSDIEKTRDQINFDEGFEEGQTLASRQLWFLENTRVGKMRFKKYLEKYDKLFNQSYGNYKPT